MKNQLFIFLFLFSFSALGQSGYVLREHKGKFGMYDTTARMWHLPATYDFLCPVNDTLLLFGSYNGKRTYENKWVYTNYEHYDELTGEFGMKIDTIVSTDTLLLNLSTGLMDINGNILIPAEYHFIVFDGIYNRALCYSGGYNAPDSTRADSYYSKWSGMTNDGTLYYASSYWDYLHNQEVASARISVWTHNAKRMVVSHADSIWLNRFFYGSDGTYAVPVFRGNAAAMFDDAWKQLSGYVFTNIVEGVMAGTESAVVVRDKEQYRFLSVRGKEIIPVKVDHYQVWMDMIIVNRGGKQKTDTLFPYDRMYSGDYELQCKLWGGTNYCYDQSRKKTIEFDSVCVVIGRGMDYDYMPGMDFEDRILRIYKKRKTGLVSSTGELILEPDYDSISLHDTTAIVYRKGKVGLFAPESRKFIMPVVYDKIKAEDGFFIASVGKKITAYSVRNHKTWTAPTSCDILTEARIDTRYGRKPYLYMVTGNVKKLLDDNFEMVIDSVDHIAYFGYVPGKRAGIVTHSNGLKGIFDFVSHTWIIRPCFEVLSGSRVYDHLLISRFLNGDSLRGVISRKAEFIIPQRFHSIDWYNEGLFYVCVRGNDTIYLDQNGKTAADASGKLKLSLRNTLSREATRIPAAFRWKSFNGPEGADVTAFFEDKNGTYWLGTGSSGGVYVSVNKGKTWTPSISGTGPVHVLDVQRFRDTLFMATNLSGDMIYNVASSGIYGAKEVYRLDEKNKQWVALDSTHRHRVYNEMNELSQLIEEKNQQKFRIEVDSRGNIFEPYYYGDSYPEFRVKVKNRLGEDSLVFANNVPADLSQTTRHCITTGEKNRIMLLTKSGVYVATTPEKGFTPMPVTGLVASDITRIIPRGKAVYVVSGTHAIWKWENNKWTRLVFLFDLNEPGYTPTGIEPFSVNVSNNGSVAFSTREAFYWMDNKGKRRKFSTETISGAAFISDTRLMAVRKTNEDEELFTVDLPNMEYGKILKKGWASTRAIFETADGNFSVRSDDGYIYTFTASGDTGQVMRGEIDYQDVVGLGADGRLMVGKKYAPSVLIRNEKTGGWFNFTCDSAQNIAAVTRLKNGGIVFATNYRYSYGGCGDNDFYEGDPELYYAYFSNDKWISVPIDNPVNKRIISLQADPENPDKVYVGTSGSGLYELQITWKE